MKHHFKMFSGKMCSVKRCTSSASKIYNNPRHSDPRSLKWIIACGNIVSTTSTQFLTIIRQPIMNAARAILRQGKSTLLICDVQERFAKAMFEFDKITQNSVKLINALKLLEVPMIVSEQNPKALGKTIPQFDISRAKGPFAKTQFSMCTPEIRKELSTICGGERPDAIILIGLEAHVCVENTAIDLREDGYEVHTVADCCTSRTQEDRLLALERMRGIGCHITTAENVIFKLLGDAKHKDFKNIQSLVKVPTLYTGLVPNAKL